MFGLNRAEVIGRLGADVTINHLVSGGRVANPPINDTTRYALIRNKTIFQWVKRILPTHPPSPGDRNTPQFVLRG